MATSAKKSAVALISLFLVAAGWAHAADPTANQVPKPGEQPPVVVPAPASIPAAAAERSQPTLAKETTQITEPLKPDGHPDYLEALNRKYSQGIALSFATSEPARVFGSTALA